MHIVGRWLVYNQMYEIAFQPQSNQMYEIAFQPQRLVCTIEIPVITAGILHRCILQLAQC